MRRDLFTEDHEAFRELARDFVEKEVVPAYPDWEKGGRMPRDVFKKMGALGMLGMAIPEEYGGAGMPDYRYNVVLQEEAARALVTLSTVRTQLEVILPYFLNYANEVQRKRWFPGLADGTLLTAVAMTEPGTGSDLAGMRTTAVRDGDHWIVNGAKTFITGGIQADLVIVVARTTPEGGSRGMSLILVETDRPGFRRGRNLKKLGHLSSDTSELFFDEVRVPATNVLGASGGAMGALMSELPQERLTIALHSIAAAQKAFDLTKDYVRQRNAFGSPIGNFQNTRFKLADLKSDLAVGWAYVDQCLREHINRELTTYAASTAKLWITEMHGRVVDQCLQFFGGYGFMREYEICRLYADARVLRIYGGTSEIMRELISRNL